MDESEEATSIPEDELEEAVQQTVDELTEKAAMESTIANREEQQEEFCDQMENNRARSEDSLRLMIADSGSNDEFSANNSPMPLTSCSDGETCAKMAMEEEKDNLDSTQQEENEAEYGKNCLEETKLAQAMEEEKDKLNSDQQEESKAQNEKNYLNEAKLQEQSSSSAQLPEQAQNQSNGVEIAQSQQQQLQQTITLKKVPIQPTPVAKILPKPPATKIPNCTEKAATATAQITSSKCLPQNAILTPPPSTIAAPKLICVTAANGTAMVSTTAANIPVPILKQLMVAGGGNNGGNKAMLQSPKVVYQQLQPRTTPTVAQQQQQRPNEIPIRPKPQQQQQQTPKPETQTSTSTKSTLSETSNDLLTNTVNKVAAGAEISPNQEQKPPQLLASTGPVAAKPKPKKKAALKMGEPGKATTTQSQNQQTKDSPNMLPMQQMPSILQQQLGGGNAGNGNPSPSSSSNMAALFPNQHFAMAPNGNLMAVSSNGMTHYLIRHPPNTMAGQFQTIPVMSSQPLFLSQMPQNQAVRLPSTTNLTQQQAAQLSQIPPQLMNVNGNMLFRSGNNIYMPTMLTPQNAAAMQQVQQQQQTQATKKGNLPKPIKPRNILPKSANSAAAKSAAQAQQMMQGLSPPTMAQMIANPQFLNANLAAQFAQQQKTLDGTATASQSPPKPKRKKKANGAMENAMLAPQMTSTPMMSTTTTLLQNGQQQQQMVVDEEENEPPPLLSRDEPSGTAQTQSLESVFQKEAKIMRDNFANDGRKMGPIVHEIDGFRIEEDVVPFPCEHQKLLAKLRDDGTGEDGKLQMNASSSSNSPEEKSKRKRSYSSTTSDEDDEELPKTSSKFLTKSSTSTEKPPAPKGRRRELANLLKMDFGPGKTPFQTSDPDEYAEEVLIGASKQQRTLAMAAEERSHRQSVESNRPSSSTKTHQKREREREKSSSQAIKQEKKSPTEKQLNDAKQSKKSSKEQHKEAEAEQQRRSGDLELEDGRCSYCDRPFGEVGRDPSHKQYCSKECRKLKKQNKHKIKSTSMDGVNKNGNNAGNVGIGQHQSAMTTPVRRSDPTIIGQSSSAGAVKSPQQTQPPQPKMTSPLGSAFAALQPQMFNTTGRQAQQQLGKPQRKCTLDELAALATHQQQIDAQQFGTSSQSFEPFGTSPPSGAVEQQQAAFMASAAHPQLAGPIHPQQQQMMAQQYAVAMHAHQLAGGSPFFNTAAATMDGLHFMPIPQQQQQLHQIMLQQQPSTSRLFASPAQFQLMQQPTPASSASAGIRQSPMVGVVQSPTPKTPATPCTPQLLDGKNSAEIEQLIGKGIQNWTPEEVAKWVNHITNSDANGERFVQQEIDGSSLILLSCEQLQNELKLKLGPAVKLNNALMALKAKSYMG